MKRKRAHVLIMVIQDQSKAKKVLKKLEEIGVPGATVMDTMGTETSVIPPHNIEGFKASNEKLGVKTNFNKTVFSVVSNEEIAMLAMDEVEKILEIKPGQPSRGIMFTIPLVGQMGLL